MNSMPMSSCQVRLVKLWRFGARDQLPNCLPHAIRRHPLPQLGYSRTGLLSRPAGEGFPATCWANNSDPMAPLNFEVPWCNLNCRTLSTRAAHGPRFKSQLAAGVSSLCELVHFFCMSGLLPVQALTRFRCQRATPGTSLSCEGSNPFEDSLFFRCRPNARQATGYRCDVGYTGRSTCTYACLQIFRMHALTVCKRKLFTNVGKEACDAWVEAVCSDS